MLQKLKNRKNNQEGFTIIEVLIVLAIAGLILLIVFLAVPALQRNARNTQRKNDVAAILGAASEFGNNNSGAVPTVACGAANPYSLNTGACPGTGTGASFKQGYYQAAPVIATGAQLAIGSDTARLVTGASCGAAGATAAGSARQVAVQYEIEGSAGLTPTCQEG